MDKKKKEVMKKLTCSKMDGKGGPGDGMMKATPSVFEGLKKHISDPGLGMKVGKAVLSKAPMMLGSMGTKIGSLSGVDGLGKAVNAIKQKMMMKQETSPFQKKAYVGRDVSPSDPRIKDLKSILPKPKTAKPYKFEDVGPNDSASARAVKTAFTNPKKSNANYVQQ